MTSWLKKLTWKRSTVSWLSFTLLSLIVAATGISGTQLIFKYLYEQLMEHGIEHNQEIASNLVPKLERAVENNPADISLILTHAISDYKTFGYRIFVIDRSREEIIVDSQQPEQASQPLKQSWLSQVTSLDGIKADISSETGAFLTSQQHPMLVWVQPMRFNGSNRLALGIAQNQKALVEFTENLHLYVDGVMLTAFVLITLLGYFAMRSTGRFYERTLESQVRERTLALKKAHEDALTKTRLATIGKTATVLTHEMRNPMASIKLALSGLNGSTNLNSREQRRVSMVLSEIDRLDSLLSDTLDYVRPVKLSANPLDFNRLLDKVIQQQANLVERKQIHLNFNYCEECSQLHMDSAQMHQVLLNLIKNAIEACPEQGHIDIDLHNSKTRLVLQITNDGEMLTKETINHAFDPFFTTKPKGTGLGLGLVKRVVEEHHGQVEIKNTQDERVRVSLVFLLS
jgi:signal transduction histidine kinase